MKPSSQKTWSTEAYPTFYVNGNGKVKCMELSVVGKGATVEEAREEAYKLADMVNFEGKYCRRDI